MYDPSICKQQNKYDSKIENWFRKGRKLCWKRRQWLLPAFSPFPIIYLKVVFLTVVQSQICEVKG